VFIKYPYLGFYNIPYPRAIHVVSVSISISAIWLEIFPTIALSFLLTWTVAYIGVKKEKKRV